MVSISSEAMAARWPPHSLASSRISLESTSSFFWTSPWMFSLSRLPNTPPRAPLPTAWPMALQARATISISSRTSGRSAVAPRCCSTRYWVRVLRFMGCLASNGWRSDVQRLGDDFRDVARQPRVAAHALEPLAHGLAQCRNEARPVVQRARQPRGDLGIEGIERQHLLGPEVVALAVGPVHAAGVVHAELEDQRARAVRVAQGKGWMRHQRAHLFDAAGRGNGLQGEPLVYD